MLVNEIEKEGRERGGENYVGNNMIIKLKPH